MNPIARHYDDLASHRGRLRTKHKYYYSLLTKYYRYFIPEGKSVLEIGCGIGDLLSDLKPSYGVGVDVSPKMIDTARTKYPHLKFYAVEGERFQSEEKFDYIVLSGVLGEAEDIQILLEKIKKFTTKDTRVVIESYNYFWQYALKIAEKFNLKIPQRIGNWITPADIDNFLMLAGFETVKHEGFVIFPVSVWGLSTLLNQYVARLPFLNALTLTQFTIARPRMIDDQKFSTTILIPCRNEKGNIEHAIMRTPTFGGHQEFIFVEGHSSDGTKEEVERMIKKYPQKDIKLFVQSGRGKGDAVRLGFGRAQGDVLMILDADLTTPPEEMPKFFNALIENKGEFINGSRLVYPMETQAMRFLNLVANKFFGIFFSWLLGQRFKDTLCGTKVMFRHHYEQLVRNRAYFGDFDPFGDFDLIFGAVKMNLKVVELPIHYKDRQYGTTQIQRFRHGMLLLRMCWFAMGKIKFI